ncbi:MAG: thiamine-phosphate kinase [Candidatus Hermodarchaeota archaeon]
MSLSKASNLGERRIIEILIENLDKMPKMPIPFGDDISAIPFNKTRLAVLKTDMLVGRTDIPPGMTLRQAARKAVVMNISDLAAKGVKPLALLTALGLPRETIGIDIKEIAEGLNAGAREYGTYVIGGDTGEATDLVICCVAFGFAMKKKLILRGGAKAGDILAVTGFFGKSGAGLKMLIEGWKVPPRIRERLLDAVYLPKARLREGLILAKTGAASASIDSSDGLAISLHELKKMSNVGFTLTDLPIAPETIDFAELFGLNPEELVLYGGEEYELVLTIKPSMWKRAKEDIENIGGSLIAIGKATEEEKIILNRDSVVKEIAYKGWEHFKSG